MLYWTMYKNLQCLIYRTVYVVAIYAEVYYLVSLSIQYGETTLTLACKNGNLRLVERLLSMGANPDIGNNVSVCLTHCLTLSSLICWQYKETPVLIATQLGMKEILKELLEKGANPNKVRADAWTSRVFHSM